MTAATDITELVAPIWRRRWLILAIALAAAGGAYLVSANRTEHHSARSQILVQDAASQQVLVQQVPQDPVRDAANQAQIVVSTPVANAVRSALGLGEAPAALLADVRAAPLAGTGIVQIVATRASASDAVRLADAFAQQYLVFRRAQTTADLNASIAATRRQLARLPSGPQSAQQTQELTSQLDRLIAARVSVPTEARQVLSAVGLPRANPHREVRRATFAFALALLLGSALALVAGLWAPAAAGEPEP